VIDGLLERLADENPVHDKKNAQRQVEQQSGDENDRQKFGKYRF
jgi:hypothetical protein